MFWLNVVESAVGIELGSKFISFLVIVTMADENYLALFDYKPQLLL